jgi:hypothetical protein
MPKKQRRSLLRTGWKIDGRLDRSGWQGIITAAYRPRRRVAEKKNRWPLTSEATVKI